MGYDRTSTMFSPEGRLLQAEYAKKTIKHGTSALGIVYRDGVLLLADKRVVDKLILTESVEKVFQVDDHIGAAASGILSDGRILIEKAQIISQQHRVTYDETIDTHTLVKEICDTKQWFTQMGGVRPFGVALLIAGVNTKPSLFVTDPTGLYFEYKATAIGEGEDEIKEILNKRYKENMSLNDAVKLGMFALRSALKKQFSLDRIDGAYIDLKEKQYHKINKDFIRKIK